MQDQMEEYIPTLTDQNILCCGCGILIKPNPANMCAICLSKEVDITEGIPKQTTLFQCKNCERYLQPPEIWVQCELESRELLAVCLKKLKGLGKVNLKEANFIWTEPHSKRIKVKIVFGAIILQPMIIEFTINSQQCPGCEKVMAKNVWKAVVQVEHKKTFYFLEQLILKHKAHKDTTNISEVKDGIDFYYLNQNQAVKMVEFLRAVVPVKYKSGIIFRTKTSEQLISADSQSNTSNYKFTYSVDIVPEDLICLPKTMALSIGNIGRLLLCYKVGTSLQVINPFTLASSLILLFLAADLSCAEYYRSPFKSLLSSSDLFEFYILDIESTGVVQGKNHLADVQLARINDFNTTFFTKTHLGSFLKIGDTVYCYDLSRSAPNNDSFDNFNTDNIPEIIIIKKSYPNRRRKNKMRKWKLNKLKKQEEELKNVDRAKQEKDFEMFLRDIEEDKELRSGINLYKNSNAPCHTDSEMDDEDFPDIELDELLDNLNINADDEI